MNQHELNNGFGYSGNLADDIKKIDDCIIVIDGVGDKFSPNWKAALIKLREIALKYLYLQTHCSNIIRLVMMLPAMYCLILFTKNI